MPLETYSSLIDWWLVAVLVGAPLFVAVIGLLLRSKSRKAGNIILIASIAYGAVIALLTFPCKYTLDGSELHVRCGVLVDQTVPYEAIESLERSSDPRSAPALSLNRLKIHLKDGGVVIISPERQEEFMAKMQERIENSL